MQGTILILTTLCVVAFAAPPPPQDDGKIHIPDKCSDVLAVKVCDNLEKLAIRLKLNAQDVKKAVVEAVKQGKTSSEEIFNAAKKYLMDEVLSKKCEDFTAADTCAKLRKLAGILKINAQKLEVYVIRALAEGSSQASEIYKKVMEYYKEEIKTKKCEDFLSQNHCDNLRKIATKLKIKADDFEDAVREAYIKAMAEGKNLVNQVIAQMKDIAMNTKCEDLLNPDLCKSLRNFAAVTKVQLPILMEKAIDLIIKGADVSKKLLQNIYKLVDHFYDCQDIFDKPSCEKLQKVAEFFGVATTKIEEFLKKYIPIVVETGKDIYANFPTLLKEFGNYIKNDLWCKISPTCFSADEIMVDGNDVEN